MIAKLFEIDGRQVLCHQTRSDEDEDQVAVYVEMKEGSCLFEYKIALGFGKNVETAKGALRKIDIEVARGFMRQCDSFIEEEDLDDCGDNE